MPLDKYESDKIFTTPPDPLGGVKVKYLNFAMTINLSLLSIFYQNFACKHMYNIYETHQTGFQFEGLGPATLVKFGSGAKAKIHVFQNMVMLHIKLKEMAHTATL